MSSHTAGVRTCRIADLIIPLVIQIIYQYNEKSRLTNEEMLSPFELSVLLIPIFDLPLNIRPQQSTQWL